MNHRKEDDAHEVNTIEALLDKVIACAIGLHRALDLVLPGSAYPRCFRRFSGELKLKDIPRLNEIPVFVVKKTELARNESVSVSWY